MKKKLLCVCGKSGVGKTSILFSSGLENVVSYTTRKMRAGEVDGVDYNFRDHLWMLHHRHKFSLDWKIFNGNVYGATDDDLFSKDAIVITLDSAVHLRRVGLPVYIMWIDGVVRSERNRNQDVDFQGHCSEIDFYLTNDGTISDAGSQIKEIFKKVNTDGIIKNGIQQSRQNTLQ